MLNEIIKQYPIDKKELIIQPFGNGLINNTWKVTAGNKGYILQRVNTTVFKNPELIDENIRKIGSYFSENYPDYQFVMPVENENGKTLIKQQQEYFRLFPFVNNSFVYDKLENENLAYEAAGQFGKFTKLLSDFDASKLNTTLPEFHNLNLRHQQFVDAKKTGIHSRINLAAKQLKQLDAHENILLEYQQFMASANKKLRVMHHDTKISNVLFNADNKGICVIDLDTVMPGYFISDVGDMMRTYLSPANEEEQDFNKIIVRKDYYNSIVKGYLNEMESELSDFEKSQFLFAGKFMIYMQALRFMTDYLLGDTYYPVKYPDNNLVRAENQIRLLKQLILLN